MVNQFSMKRFVLCNLMIAVLSLGCQIVYWQRCLTIPQWKEQVGFWLVALYFGYLVFGRLVKRIRADLLGCMVLSLLVPIVASYLVQYVLELTFWQFAGVTYFVFGMNLGEIDAWVRS